VLYFRSILIIVTPLLLLSSCTMNQEYQQTVEEQNIVKLLCTEGLVTSNLYVESVDQQIPAHSRQIIAKLLLSAEIESQFGKYPECLDQLERAFYFLSQVEINAN